MARRVAGLLSGAAILLGLAHLSISALSFGQLSFQALWFTGSGVAIVLAGMINLLGLLASYGRGGRVVLVAANLAMAAFFGLALAILPAPQVIAGLILFLALAALPRVASPQAA